MYDEGPRRPTPVEIEDELRRLAASQQTLAPRRTVAEASQPWRAKSPAVVLRADGRYGVAAHQGAARGRDIAGSAGARSVWEDAVRGRISERTADRLIGGLDLDTSDSSGYRHEATTYASREEAEKRAWALARELGSTGDWP